jgi:hypothetical protein
MMRMTLTLRSGQVSLHTSLARWINPLMKSQRLLLAPLRFSPFYRITGLMLRFKNPAPSFALASVGVRPSFSTPKIKPFKFL